MIKETRNIHLFGGDNPLLTPTAKGEVDIYGSLSREDIAKYERAYVEEHKQPYHQVVKQIEQVFGAHLGGRSAFSEEGWKTIVSNDGLYKKYVDTIANGLFRSSESWRTAFVNTLNNSVAGMRTDPMGGTNFPDYIKQMRAAEGVGAMATYQNRDNFSGMNALGIGGFFGQSKALEIYHPIENNTLPEWSYKYNLDFVIDPKTNEEVPLPKAWRSDWMYGKFDLPKAIPIFIDAETTPHIMDKATKVKVLDKSATATHGSPQYKDEDLGDGWIKTGYETNLLVDSSTGDNNITSDNGLEPTVEIEEVLYIADFESSSKAPIYKKLKVNSVAVEAAGYQNVFHFRFDLSFDNPKYLDKSEIKTLNGRYTEKVFGDVNVDTGEFSIATLSANAIMRPIIVAVKPYARVSDNTNTNPGIEHSTRRVFNTLRCEYTNFGRIVLTPYMLENFNLGNDSLPYVAAFTDLMTKSYTRTRDAKAEHKLMDDMEKPVEKFALYHKLGGFEKQIVHDAATTGPLTATDPYAQNRFALRERVIRALSRTETVLNFPQTVARSWVFYGPDMKVQAFADVENFNQKGGEGADAQPVNSGSTRFGFNIDESASFIDSLGRNVKMIGCTDERWDNRNIIGGMKSYNPEYPTFLYYPYMFRVFTGIDSKYTTQSSVLFFGRDGIFSMIKAHAEIIINNYDDNLYENTVKSAKTSYVFSR